MVTYLRIHLLVEVLALLRNGVVGDVTPSATLLALLRVLMAGEAWEIVGPCPSDVPWALANDDPSPNMTPVPSGI